MAGKVQQKGNGAVITILVLTIGLTIGSMVLMYLLCAQPGFQCARVLRTTTSSVVVLERAVVPQLLHRSCSGNGYCIFAYAALRRSKQAEKEFGPRKKKVLTKKQAKKALADPMVRSGDWMCALPSCLTPGWTQKRKKM
jgi:hypothetical protein